MRMEHFLLIIKQKYIIRNTNYEYVKVISKCNFLNRKIDWFFNSVSLTVVTLKCDQPAASIVSIQQENIYSQKSLCCVIKLGKHHEYSNNLIDQNFLLPYKKPNLQKLKDIKVMNSYLVGYDRTLQIYDISLFKYSTKVEIFFFINRQMIKDYGTDIIPFVLLNRIHRLVIFSSFTH
ncbi:unnamed protein product [Paramecium octaurelia]|uniref:Uncharacterized protein n=1 Tax=Paramecium octaurelia TaxID=43137 RepID=A0A8S1TGT4_PAROT|nr:unnamed protein product [Paramecium octaurelia]